MRYSGMTMNPDTWLRHPPAAAETDKHRSSRKAGGKGMARTLQAGRAAAADHAEGRPGRRSKDTPITHGPWIIADDTRRALERCELFQDLGRDQLASVAALVEEHSLQPDELLLREGEPARYLFVVVEGRAVAQLQMERGWLCLGLVGPGDAAGWSSLLDGRIYPASVRALLPMRVARIESSGLTLLMNLEPGIGYPVHKRLSAIFHRQYEEAVKAFKTT